MFTNGKFSAGLVKKHEIKFPLGREKKLNDSFYQYPVPKGEAVVINRYVGVSFIGCLLLRNDFNETK